MLLPTIELMPMAKLSEFYGELIGTTPPEIYYPSVEECPAEYMPQILPHEITYVIEHTIHYVNPITNCTGYVEYSIGRLNPEPGAAVQMLSVVVYVPNEWRGLKSTGASFSEWTMNWTECQRMIFIHRVNTWALKKKKG